MDRRQKKKKDPSRDYIERICDLYGDTYDDREEDSKPGGETGFRARKRITHLSLHFRRC